MVWHCLPIKRIYGPPEARKYLVGFKPKWFSKHDFRITGLQRHGKFLILCMDDFNKPLKDQPATLIQIHLSSTGWILPENELAFKMAEINPIVHNFLHTINYGNGSRSKTRRFSIEFGDGQVWSYHDPRTWGRWTMIENVRDWKALYLRNYGFDFIEDEGRAYTSLMGLKSNRRVKEVLTDQHVAAGIGNYLACEAAFSAGIHPYQSWKSLDKDAKERLFNACVENIQAALGSNDHEHWNVFRRVGLPCKRCRTPIEYDKDSRTAKARGSYFCPQCQKKR
jgi:formamidopyrimidine-DNA glycosylase